MDHVVELVDLKKRSDVHLARKIWHMAGVSFMALIYSLVPESWALGLLMFAWMVFVPADILRQTRPRLNRVLVTAFRPIMRQSEMHRLAGTSFLLTGIFIVALLFPRDVVLLTFLFLAFADPMASYFGVKFGKDKILGEKSLQGSLAAFIVCALITYFYLSYNELLLDRVLVFSVLAGIIGSLAELIPIRDLDDNLTLPLVSAVALWGLMVLFGVYTPFL